MYDRAGRFALRFGLSYLGRRYRRQIRLGAVAAGVAIGVAAYFASRNVPEG